MSIDHALGRAGVAARVGQHNHIVSTGFFGYNIWRGRADILDSVYRIASPTETFAYSNINFQSLFSPTEYNPAKLGSWYADESLGFGFFQAFFKIAHSHARIDQNRNCADFHDAGQSSEEIGARRNHKHRVHASFESDFFQPMGDA